MFLLQPMWGEGFVFNFTEDVVRPIQGQNTRWIAENITVIPSLSLDALTMGSSSFYIQTSNFSNGTTYRIDLNSRIRSSDSGVSLTPRSIFLYANPNSAYTHT